MISKLLNHPRHPFLLLFATCAGLLGFGLYLSTTAATNPA